MMAMTVGGGGQAPMRDILVAGAGPAGLGSALELDKVLNTGDQARFRITVVDPVSPITAFDPAKGFMYLIRLAGLMFMQRHTLMQSLEDQGVDGRVVKQEIFDTEGKLSKKSFSMTPDAQPSPYWITREDFIALLEKQVKLSPGGVAGRIVIRDGWGLKSLDRIGDKGAGGLTATLREEASGKEETLEPFLVVGADGLRSKVRASLVEWAKQDGGGAELEQRFDMLPVKSPAAGLKYKVLSLAGDFPLPAEAVIGGGGTPEAEMAYVMVSTYAGKDVRKETRLGILPRKSKDRRTANIITWPDHALFSDPELATEQGMRAFLRESYPQMDWDKAVKPEEIKRFAEATPGRFPDPQTTKGAATFLLPEGKAGVVLVGDALHAYPPDLGQGVNHALADVSLLGASLEAHNSLAAERPGEVTLHEALRAYDEEACGEAKALVRLMQIGAPWQYSQPGAWPWLAKRLHLVNQILRLVLSKIPLLGNRVFYPQAAMMSGSAGEISYRTILKRANQTTYAILGGCIAVAAALLRASGMAFGV